MSTSIRVLVAALLLLGGLSPVGAQQTAATMVRNTLRTTLGEMDVARTYRILSETLLDEDGVDITTAHAVPRTQLSSALYQATFRNVRGPELCARFKVTYVRDAYHDPQFVLPSDENHLVAPKQHLSLLTVWGRLEGQSFRTPQWRIGQVFWAPAPEGERRCDANAPADLAAWIASRHDTYEAFRTTNP